MCFAAVFFAESASVARDLLNIPSHLSFLLVFVREPNYASVLSRYASMLSDTVALDIMQSLLKT